MDLVKFVISIFMVINLLQEQVAASNCSYPGSPAHSRVSFSNAQLQEGTVASYFCEQGFELLGPSRRICEGGHWSPDGIPFCVINVAAGKAPMQISTEEGGTPQKALDGSSALVFSTETCTLTKCERVPWWYVNLLEPYMVQLVRLDFGKPCCGINTPATIVVRVGNNRPDLATNPICNRFTGFLEEGQPLFLPCNPPMAGAFVSVHLEAAIPSQLSICEAFVYTDQALPIERCPQFRDQPLGSAATYNGKCYIFYDRQPASFPDALTFCTARGGTLVDESNPALQGFISWELWRRHRSDSSSQYWMGAVRDPQNPTNWKWINGKDVTISFWNAPARGEGCARFDGSKGWLWADTNCQSELNYICQHQPKACGRPEQPPNSTLVAERFDVGATVEYSCDEGHLLVGPTVRTCLDTGFYDAFAPLCKMVQCEKPALIPNGRVSLSSDAAVFGAVAEYACSKGFILDGARRIECLATGLWDSPAPRCYPEERSTTSTTTLSPSTTTRQPTISPSTTSTQTPEPTPPRLILPTRPRTHRPVTSPPTEPPTTRRLRPKITTTERTTTRSYEKPPTRKTTVLDSQGSSTSHVPHIILASNAKEKHQNFDNGHNTKAELAPGASLPPVEASGARLNIGAVVALAAFGTVVFLIAIIVTLVILFKSRTYQLDDDMKSHYRHCTPPGFHSLASLDSSSSESRSGLNKYYRQAWEELNEATGGKHAHRREREAPKDGSELVVSDVYPARTPVAKDKRRRHHHHHRHEPRLGNWRSTTQAHNSTPKIY